MSGILILRDRSSSKKVVIDPALFDLAFLSMIIFLGFIILWCIDSVNSKNASIYANVSWHAKSNFSFALVSFNSIKRSEHNAAQTLNSTGLPSGGNNFLFLDCGFNLYI